MSECNGLSKFKTYDLGFVKQDEAEGSIAVQIVNPPASCPDGIYITHKGEIVVNSSAHSSTLVYSNHAVITVRNKDAVEVTNPSSGAFGYIVGFGVVAIVAYVLYKLFTRKPANDHWHYASGSQTNVPAPAVSNGVAGGTTIINNGSGNGGFVNGMILGSMLNNHSSSTVIEKTTVIDRSRDDYSSSSSRDDSYSSDSSSSFGSDSSSSYGSDSSSSFGSDSGGSFGSDGGGSFGND